MKKINNFSFFDGPFFSFSFKLISKKVSVYLTAILYFVMVFCYTTIVPLISESETIEMFSSPVSGMFLMFCISMVGSFLAIEIFRTSIDDGTELLTVSKPISRKEVVMVKLTIFLLFIVAISILSLSISGFMFLNPLGNKNDNIKILIGIFAATLINGVIFGSIATLLSLFCKKIISLLITLSITFILMVYSMLSSFVVKSPITKMQQDGNGLKLTSLIDYKYDEQNKIWTLDLIQGSSVISVDEKIKTPSQLWTKYSNNKSYLLSSYFDFGYQLSSLYTLSEPNQDIKKSIQTMSFFNTPVSFEFKDITVPTQLHIPINIAPNKLGLSLIKSDSAKFEDKSGNKNGIYSVSYRASIASINSTIVKEQDNLWDKTWSELKLNFNNNNDYFIDHGKKFLEEFSKLKKLTFNNKLEIIKELDSILLSGFNKFYKIQQKTNNPNNNNNNLNNDENNKRQFSTLLNLLGIKFDKNQKNNAYLKFNPLTEFTYASQELTYRPTYSLISSLALTNFQKMTSVSTMNRDILIGVWSSIAVIIFIVTMILYSRRDFA